MRARDRYRAIGGMMGLSRIGIWVRAVLAERIRRISLRAFALIFAVTFAMAAAATLIWRGDGQVKDPLAAFARVDRRVEARLTQLPYDASHVTRSAQASSDLRRDAAIAQLMQEVVQSRTSGNLHRLALAHLAVGSARAAEGELEGALRLDPDDASILSDLAAAEMTLGRILDAGEHSARALQIDPARQSAAYNWALILEKLSNRPMAIEAWEKYLTLDSASGWAAQARLHLSRLRQKQTEWDEDKLLLRPGADAETIARLVKQYPYRSRARSHNIFLPAWVANGTPADLEVIRAIAALHSDPFLHDVVEHAASRRAEVAPAFRVYAAAFLAQQSDLKASGTLYAEAAELLDRVQSPLAHLAAIYATRDAPSDQVPARQAALDARLAALGDRYPSVIAEAEWLRGINLVHAGKSHDALQALRRALEYARRAGEVENEAGIAQVIALQLDIVGDPAEAERYRIEVLGQQEAIHAHPLARYVGYMDTAFSALRNGRPRLALAFVQAASTIAHHERDPLFVAETESQQALALLEIGDPAAAAGHLALAKEFALKNQPGKYRDRILGDIEYITGRMELPRRPEAAIEAYSEAIAIWQANHWRFHPARGRLSRGDAALAIGDRVMAESDYRAGIADMESQRESIDEPAMRVAYFENAEVLFERLTQLLLDQDRFADALSIAERKRARVLLDQIALNGSSATQPLDGNSVAATVEPGTAILEIMLLDRGAELWLVRDGAIVHARSEASGEAIASAVARHMEAIAADQRMAVRRSGGWLYRQLVAPVAGDLPAETRLVIVPDGALQAFPFATLVMPNNQYLFERYPISVAPSASVFLQTPREDAEGSFLVVSQPAPEGFPSLPGAAREVAHIAGRDRNARLLSGTEIGPDEFLALAAEAATVHFAGHARTNVDHPSHSSLLFESRPGESAEITAAQIAAAHLRNHPLIVLAACGTGQGRLRRNEGMDSLAAAFLQAGARGVVATLWDIDDDPVAELFRSFHEHRRNGAGAAEALREAQRSMMHSPDPQYRSPAVWGGAVVIGAQ